MLDACEIAARCGNPGSMGQLAELVGSVLQLRGVSSAGALQGAALPVAVLGLVFACSQAPAAMHPAPEAALHGAPAPAPAAEDSSLELAAYSAAGIPDPNIPWRAEQYEQAVQSLLRSSAAGRSQLPRRSSPRSGALFARLVAPDNFFFTAAVPPAEQALLAARAVALVSTLCGLYAPGNDGLNLGSEQVALVAALLRRLNVALDRSRALARSDASGNEAYEQQKQAVQPVFRGALKMLGETSRYSPAERAELRSALLAERGSLLAHLSAGDRGALEEQLASAR